MIKMILGIMLMGVAVSCTLFNHQYDNALNNLDAQLEQHPELVWDSLKKIDPQKLNESQQAYYYLLLASATDKNLVYLADDSTLRIALEYFDEQKDYYNLARCQYYLGKYVYKKRHTKEAYHLFKQAQFNFDHSPQNPHLLGLIYYQLGLIQKQQGNLSEAKIFFQDAYKLFLSLQDTIAASYALKYKGVVESKNYRQAKNDLLQSLDLISSIKTNSEKAFLAKNTILSAISLFYRKKDSLALSLEYSKKCLASFIEKNVEIPSEYYYNILIVFYKLNQIDSAKYYCKQMIKAANKQNNSYNLINGYNVLAQFEEKANDYKEACDLRRLLNTLKDSINKTINTNNILEIEKKYNAAETQRLLLKAENKNLKIYGITIILVFTTIIISLLLYHRHKKLKLKYDELTKAVKHTEWGFSVTKEFITENHIAYDELERILNREKSLMTIDASLYNKLHDTLILQKANYSGRLFDRLTNFDGSFGTKFQQLFPDFTTDELLMASMIHHKWKITDMTMIFHISVDAIRKRKARLENKISSKLKRKIDIDDFLTNL